MTQAQQEKVESLTKEPYPCLDTGFVVTWDYLNLWQRRVRDSLEVSQLHRSLQLLTDILDDFNKNPETYKEEVVPDGEQMGRLMTKWELMKAMQKCQTMVKNCMHICTVLEPDLAKREGGEASTTPASTIESLETGMDGQVEDLETITTSSPTVLPTKRKRSQTPSTKKKPRAKGKGKKVNLESIFDQAS